MNEGKNHIFFLNQCHDMFLTWFSCLRVASCELRVVSGGFKKKKLRNASFFMSCEVIL